MTRLRILLSHHPTATHHPPVVHGTNNNTLQAHHTISHNRHFALSYCLPVSFCLVTRGTHPLIILDPPASSCPLTKFQKGASHRTKIQQTLHSLPTECRADVQSRCFAQSDCILHHQPFAFPKNQLHSGLHFVSPAGCAMHQAWSDAVGGVH